MQKISILGPISGSTVDVVKSQIDAMDRTAPLLLEINSDGGAVSEGVTLYNLLRGWPGGLEVQVVGWALSIASLILMAGQKRSAHENALIMVHAPWTNTSGNAGALRDNAAMLDRVAGTMMQAYRVTGKNDSVIRDWFNGQDHWFTASEALSAGLIDLVISDAIGNAAPANAMATKHPIPAAFSQRIYAMSATTTQNANTQTGQSVQNAFVVTDRERRETISARFGRFVEADGVPELLAACQNDPACTVEAAGLKLLAHIGSRSSPVSGHVTVRTDVNHLQEFKAAAQDVLLARAGIRVAEPHPGARDLQRMGIVGMADSILSMLGKSDRNRSAASIIHAAMSTSDFPSLLSGIANKALSIGYDESPANHTVFTAEREVANFKQNTLVNLSEFPGLEHVPELAEYTNGSMSDSASFFQLATFGKVIKFSRQALINDDLSAFTMLPKSMGAAARRLEADKVFALLTDNPVLGDGHTLFSSEHGNQGAALQFTIDGLSTARAAMRKQRGIGGLAYLDPQPRYLIVPVALETKAEQLLASLVDPSTQNATPNSEFIRGLTLVSDPRLDVASTSTWYLAASPKQVEGILRAYLSGERMPFLEEATEFKTDAISYKVRLDFAAGVMDYRGLYRSTST